MMTSDIVATIINQRHLVRCVQRLETIDHKLRNENISINYRPLQLLSIVLIITLFSRKCLMILFAYCGFHLRLLMLWMKNVPIFASLLSKLWFVLIVANIRRKFEAINHHLNELADSLKATKETAQNAIEANSKIARRDSDRRSDSRESSGNSENISQYLRNEISTRPKPKFFEKMMRSNMNVVQPFDGNNRPIMVNSHISPKMDGSLLGGKVHEITIGDKFDQQLTNLCFVHDEVCEIASIANNMYSFQILILMTHGFLAITAQLYFVYCSLAGQVIRSVIFFRTSANFLTSSKEFKYSSSSLEFSSFSTFSANFFGNFFNCSSSSHRFLSFTYTISTIFSNFSLFSSLPIRPSQGFSARPKILALARC